MIDALIVEVAVAAGCAGLALAAPRGARVSRPLPRQSLNASIAKLPFRRQREARGIVALARDQVARHPAGSVESFTAREMLNSYLPETLAAYLAVPVALRRARSGAESSPDEELRRQLRTLTAGLEQAQAGDALAGAARMAQNAAFLHERFGPPPVAERSASILRELAEVLGAHLRRA